MSIPSCWKAEILNDLYPDWTTLHRDLVNFVQRKVGEKNIAEDIVQDVFIKICTKADQLKDKTRFLGWAFQITRNAINDHFRNENRRTTAGYVDSNSNEQELNECAAQCLAMLIQQLPDKYRLAIQLTDLENRSQHELARILNISHAGARSRVQRARKMLRDRMEEYLIIRADAYGNITFCESRDPYCCGPE